MTKLKSIVENAWNKRELLGEKHVKEAIEHVIDHLDRGEYRVAEQRGDEWVVNTWILLSAISVTYTRPSSLTAIPVGELN